MSKAGRGIDKVRVSRAGHTFHERWAARRALQLVFPKDGLFAIVVEGLSPNERLKLGQEAEDIADLTLFYGSGDTFETCTTQQILQFKYKEAPEPVTDCGGWIIRHRPVSGMAAQAGCHATHSGAGPQASDEWQIRHQPFPV